MDKLMILGTGDSMGVPRVYCECEVCREARLGGRNRRLRSSVVVDTEEGMLWIDCGPDWKEQMENIGKRELERALLTHAHFDHMAGLPEWADACRWTGRKGTLYAPAEVLGQVRERYPWLERNLNYWEIDRGMDFGGWAIRARKVSHGKNGYSFAYRFEMPGFSWVYCPDSINLQGEEKAFLTDLDLLVLGTSYYKEEFEHSSRSVYDMVEAGDLLAEVRPKYALFTHMSHGVDVREEYPLPEGVRLAAAGMVIPLSRAAIAEE